ncbi:MAG: futalosine hydrolase [Pseudomonadota bacterium]
MNPDLLILSATPFEVSSFLDRCPGEYERSTLAGQSIISGHIGSKTYDLLITGPGVFNAAHALTAYLEQPSANLKTSLKPNLKPGLILQTGIAGVFEQTGLKIGDIAIATSDHYIHTGVESDCLPIDPLPFDLIKKEPESRKGFYPFDTTRVENFYKKLCQQADMGTATIGKGPFITVSTITASFDTAHLIYNAFSPVMEAMEGAASAHIARLYDIPMIQIRAASNLVGERNRSNWNIDLAVERLGWACSALFEDQGLKTKERP